MSGNQVIIAGIPIPFENPFLLAIVGIHILAGVVCIIAGIAAMLSKKGPGRHPVFGSVYYWSYLVMFVTTAILSIFRWADDYYLFIIGILSFTAVFFGRTAVKLRLKSRFKIHITGMGISYILMIISFYLDNGKSLPVWKDLPAFTYWLIPSAAGLPFIIYALLKYKKMDRTG